MIGDSQDEYDLVDPEEPNEAPTAPRPTPTGTPGRPLPRMWKAEDDAPPPPASPPRSADSSPSNRRRSPRGDDAPGFARKTGLKPKATDDGEKKVLIEETPVLDTYETRQRVRLATGGLVAFVIGLGCYLVYSSFIYDPFPMDDLPADDAYPIEAAPDPARSNVEGEARAMLARARDSAANGRTDEAVALLQQLVKTYKNTQASTEAKAALERPSQGLPLFLAGPTIAATPPATPSPTQPSPATVAVRSNAEVLDDAEAAAPSSPNAVVTPPSSEPAAAADASVDRRPPAGFAAKPEAGVDPSGWPLAIVGDRDGATMVLVPGGVFPMGDDRDPASSPVHKVRLSTYYIDQHETTVGQFRRFLAESRYRGKSGSNWSQLDPKAQTPDDHPIVMVNHADALAFAEWAGKTLPTEAQWEAAVRTSDGRTQPWGDDPPRDAAKRPLRQVGAVMAVPEDRSAYGAFDLAGNVLEWTADAWDRQYYRSLVGRIVDDPTGPQPRGRYDVVVKGGKGTGAGREPIAPEKRMNYVGFRCALQVEHPATPVVAPTPQPTPPPTAPPTPSGTPEGPAVVPF